MATIQDLGKVAYLNKGAYNSETNYEVNDVVSFNGSSYVSMVNNNRGNLPTNTNYWSIVALKGDKGDTGKAFVIEKTYQTIEAMVADYDNMNVNDYVMISGSIEDEKNATLWTKTETEVSPYKWVYLADFSGASGITGATPNIQIGTVTEGNQPSVTRRGTNENPIFDFVLKTGAKGDTGETGNGISSITKTGTSGLVDTYTVAYTNGNNMTFDVTNGNGIYSIVKTSTSGSVDTYTITYTNGNTSTFDVTNGEVTQEAFDALKEDVEDLRDNQIISDPVEGTEISVSDGAKARVYEFGMSKESSQETTTGKNLFPLPNTESKNNVSFIKNEDGTFNISTNGTASADSDFLVEMLPTFLTDDTYTVATKSTGYQVHVSFYNNTSWLSTAIYKNEDIVTRTQSITIPNNATRIVFMIRILNGTSVNLTNETIMLEKSSTATDYEEYTGGQPSPSPDYPQEVKTVKGYRNLFDKDNANILNAYFAGEKTINTSANAKILWISCKASTTYTIQKIKSARFRIATSTLQPAIGETTLSFIYDDNATSLTITTENNANYILVYYFYNGTDTLTEQEILDSVMITEGTEKHPYVPYGNNYVDVKVTGKNLFKLDNIGIATASSGKVVADATKGIIIDVRTVDNLYISGDYTLLDNNMVRIGYFNEYPKVNLQGIRGNITTNSIINTINYNYILLNFPKKNTSITDEQIQNSFQIEKGSVATSYEPYKETIVPIPLNGNEIAGIGDYKEELIVDKNGKVWLNKLTGKVVLDGSENWNRNSNNNDTYRFYISKPNNALSPCLSQYFSYNTVYANYDNSIYIGNTNLIVSRVLTNNTYIEEISDFKAWLSTHNTPVYYVLEETNPIDLNTTVDLRLFKGVNNITNSEEADMKIRYVESIDSVINELRNAILEIGGGE